MNAIGKHEMKSHYISDLQGQLSETYELLKAKVEMPSQQKPYRGLYVGWESTGLSG